MSCKTQWLRLGVGADAAVVQRAGAILAAGGVIAAPTETVYGLMCRWDAVAARERIARLKKRAPEKHLQMLAADLESAVAAGLAPDARFRRVATAFWPGPLTAVGPDRHGGTIGLRIPRHAFVLELIRAAGFPLAATSANLSGRAPALDAETAVADLDEAPDLVVDGGPVAAGGGLSSTVVDLSTAGELRILRVGPVAEAELRRVWGDMDSPPASAGT